MLILKQHLVSYHFYIKPYNLSVYLYVNLVYLSDMRINKYKYLAFKQIK